MSGEANKYKGIAKEVTWLTHKVVHVEISGFGEISYVPGQFIMVEVGDGLKRAYGLANCPKNGTTHNIDLYIDVSPGGPGSQYFSSLEKGAKVEFSGAFGAFTVTKELAESKQSLCFLATGTGIAPIKPMIEALLVGDLKDKTKQNISLYLGFRKEKDIFLTEYFSKLENEHENFSFIYSLSQPNKNWAGNSGYVTQHLVKSNVTKQNTVYFVCGGKRATEGILDYLKKAGVSDEKIKTERF